MKQAILLTGAGGVALPALIERLRRDGYRVVAADMDAEASGLYLADQGYVIPAGPSEAFLPAVRRIIRAEGVSAIVPLVDEELVAASALEDEGVNVILPRQPFIRLCLDKLALMNALMEHGLPAPRSRAVSNGPGDLTFPLILKPRTGRGSRGVQIVRSPEELTKALRSGPWTPEQLMVQEYIEGVEYTVSVVAWRDGVVRAVVPKEVLCKRGVTRLAVTRRQPAIDGLCRRIQTEFHADGPFNVQLRVDAKTGAPIPFEINPRFSTTITLTQAAGVDELGGLVREAAGEKVSWPAAWQEDLVLLRSGREQFFPFAELQRRRARIQTVTGL